MVLQINLNFKMRHSPRIITALALFLISLAAFGQGKDNKHTSLSNLSSRQLIAKSLEYTDESDKLDSALICLQTVVGRYSPGMDKKEKRIVVNGINAMWYVYFFNYYDYAEAARCLLLAADICRDAKLSMANVNLNYGWMYHVMCEQYNDKKLASLALEYYIKSFDQAKADSDTEIQLYAFGNMVSVAYISGQLAKIKGRLDYIIRLSKKTGNNLMVYDKLLYDGYVQMVNKRYDSAIKIFNHQLNIIGNDKSMVTYRCTVLMNIADAYEAMGQYANAISYAEKNLQLAKEHDIKDVKAVTYSHLSRLYGKMDCRNKAEDCYNCYLRIKDTLFSYQQMASVSEMQFVEKQRNMVRDMNQMRQHSLFMLAVVVAVVVLSLVITVAAIIIYRKNRVLHRTNEALYMQNIFMLQTEAKIRAEHREREKVAAEVKTTKYKTSPIDDDLKRQLAGKIVAVLENTGEICSLDFSADRMAELTETKYNYVSQVINEQFGCNFTALLNKYRVQEACRRFNDIQYQNLTIEAIANSVGFRSSNAFRTSFRKVTGLSPSEYQRIAREKRIEKSENMAF